MSQPSYPQQSSKVLSLAPFNPTTMIESLDERGNGLRVVFFRPDQRSDRWGHIVAAVQHDAVASALTSVEDDDAAGWPASPPLQNMSIEQQTRGPVALAVGMACQCHWSASIEAISGQGKLVFDIACRRPSQSDRRLSSLYVSNAEISCRWQNSLALQLAEVESGNLTLTFGDDVELELNSAGVGLLVRPTSATTARWKYTLQLAPHSS